MSKKTKSPDDVGDHHVTDVIEYAQLFNSLPNAYIVFKASDPDFTIVEENAAHERISLGVRENNIGKKIFDAFPDNSVKYKSTGVSDLLESLRRVMRTGQPDTMPLLNYDVKNADGDFVVKWWRVTHYPVKNEAGKVVLLFQATEDITAEIETNSELAKTQAQLDSALAIGLVSTWYWDIKRDVVVGDRNLAGNFDISPELAAKGLPIGIFIDSIHPDDQARVTKSIQTSVAKQGDFVEEYRTVTKKGKTKWVIARGKIDTDSDGNSVNLLGVLVDITERKQAETELEQIKSMFNALFESKIISIAVADLNGNVLQANQKFLDTFGYTHKELSAGLHSSQLTPEQSKIKTANIYELLRTVGELEPTEKDYVHKDGHIIPIMVGAAMLPNSDKLFISFMLDISENKELKALNDAKDEFIALASHQLRTPATAVKQYLGILIDNFAGPVTPEQSQFLNIAYNSNERQLTIINDLLKTAQLDTKDYAVQLAEHDICAMLKDIVTEFEPTVMAKKQEILFTSSIPKITVHIDRNEMQLALINLVENASKYTPAGKKIRLRAALSNQKVIITIADEGVGIAKKDQNAIFEKFTRINNELSDTVNGSGLGLYWVKRIVALHNGQLQVQSEVGKGTTFTIQLAV